MEFKYIQVKDWFKLMSVLGDEEKVRIILKEENDRRHEIALQERLMSELRGK